MRRSVHGGTGATVARALGIDPAQVLDLSASMNPVAPDPVPVIANHLDAVILYPDPTTATAALADVIGVDADRVLLTNGGAEAIALVAAELGKGWADDCDFALYRRHLDVLDPNGPRFRSNPHNPTGLLACADETADVWDEAFYPLATGRWTRGDDAVVVGSLTKLLAAPGLRAGYVLADGDVIEQLACRQPRWAVNALVCAALPELLAAIDLPATAGRIGTLRNDLVAVVTEAGLRPQLSDANYVVCDDASERLLANGIVVRDCTSFGLPGRMRIAVPDERGLARVAEALR